MAVYSQIFSFWAFIDRDGFKAYHHAKKEFGQYPAVLTKQTLVNKTNYYYTE